MNEMKKLLALFESHERPTDAGRLLNENVEDRFADNMADAEAYVYSIEDPGVRASWLEKLDSIHEDGEGEDDDEDFYIAYGNLKRLLRKLRSAFPDTILLGSSGDAPDHTEATRLYNDVARRDAQRLQDKTRGVIVCLETDGESFYVVNIQGDSVTEPRLVYTRKYDS